MPNSFPGFAPLNTTVDGSMSGVVLPPGGSTGQALIKDSNVDYDASWHNVSGSGTGTSDHGQLTGLTDDDHPQYLNNTRGDSRYSPLSHTHTLKTINSQSLYGSGDIVISGGGTLPNDGNLPGTWTMTTSPPTIDNSTKIATTAWVNNSLTASGQVSKVSSTTAPLALGYGSKTFTFATTVNLSWFVGMRLRALGNHVNGYYMEGLITALSQTSVTINVDKFTGSGTSLQIWVLWPAGEHVVTETSSARIYNAATYGSVKAAYDAMPSVGFASVYVPDTEAGIPLGGQFTWNKPNCSLYGDGGSKIICASGTGIQVFSSATSTITEGNPYLVIHDVHFQYTNNQIAGTCIDVRGKGIKIYNVHIRYPFNALNFQSCGGSLIQAVDISEATGTCIGIHDSIAIYANQLYCSNGIGANLGKGIGMYMTDWSEGNSFTDCSFLNGEWGLFGSGAMCRYNTFTNCWFDSSTKGSTLDGVREISFTNTWISAGREASYPGMRVLNSTNVRFVNSMIANCGKEGLYVYSSNNVNLSNCSLFGNSVASANTYNAANFVSSTSCTATQTNTYNLSGEYGTQLNVLYGITTVTAPMPTALYSHCTVNVPAASGSASATNTKYNMTATGYSTMSTTITSGNWICPTTGIYDIYTEGRPNITSNAFEWGFVKHTITLDGGTVATGESTQQVNATLSIGLMCKTVQLAVPITAGQSASFYFGKFLGTTGTSSSHTVDVKFILRGT